MSDQFNDPWADTPASGAEFSTDPTGAPTTPPGGPARAAGVSGAAGTESATAAGLGGPSAASGTAYISGSTGADEVDTRGTSDKVREGAQQLGGQATESAKDTVQTAKEQVGQVASTATDQVRKLADQSRSELTEQARNQQQRLAGSLRDLGQQFGQMADKGDSSSMATQLARQASDQAHSLGSWLEGREPGDVLGEVKRFAQRKPGTFLAIAAGAGFLSGRLTRGLTGGGSESNQGGGDRYRTTTTTYGTTGARDTGSRSPQSYYPSGAAGTGTGTMDTDLETGTSLTGAPGEISEASKPSAASAPGAPPADAMGSAWEEGER
ncbi:MAG: hypothetical protein ACTHJJ_05050 [Intrasporangium sp.]|uniref:hypothetical protein n=1 Tax=Intrasporangium sp. TaxID=1925024 RepID=UPI003F7E89E8